MSKPQHDYHLVNPSPLPIMTAFSAFVMAFGLVMMLHEHAFAYYLFPVGIIMLFSCMASWWADVIHEGRVDKAHTPIVQHGLSIGMALFITSELMFFFVFFWSFFKAWLDPVHILDGVWAAASVGWPPKGIVTLDPWNIPFMNTLILLLSGTTVTWAHHELLKNNRAGMVKALYYTVGLGIVFTLLQVYEYHHATFTFKEGIYPSNFYMATGFHGAHVLIGTIFLIVCLFRAKKGHFDKGNGHLGFEFAAWYWHFVDVVWLFLFTFVYVLSN